MIKRIYLEITDACNLNCPFCTNDKGHTFMSFDDIKYCIDEIKPVCDYIYLHVLGEPTLHPNFNAILDYLDIKDMKLQLVTNGTLLKNYPGLMNHSCLRKLSISLHSISNTEVSADYFRTIEELIEYNTDKSIELRFYDRKNLDNKLKSFLKTLEEKYSFKDTAKINSYQIKENVYVYFESLFNWPNISDSYVSNTGKCHGGINQLAILHNLDVTLCCLDSKGYNRIGSLKSSSFKKILESDDYLNIIKELNNRKFIKELCQKCTYRLRFSKQ